MIRLTSTPKVTMKTLIEVVFVLLVTHESSALKVPFTLYSSHPRHRKTSCPKTTHLFSISTATDECTTQEKKLKIIEAATETTAGISATDAQIKRIDTLTRELEELNKTPNPAQSESGAGTWRVRYSNAPPPSNGQLGPFIGTALQSVDLKSGIYANELLVGSDETSPWLSATLLANWDDLGDGSKWKVNFRTITLTLFGSFNFFTKTFDEGTSRIWITTFLDDDMRIVRAGPTASEAKRLGKSADPKDYFVFIMTRESITKKVLGEIIVEPKVGLFDVLMDPARFMDDDD